MSDALKEIVLDVETELLTGIRSGADEAALAGIRDRAFDRLRAVKEGPSPPCLETIFDVAGEIGLKLDMALKVVSS
ncbi:hypothetical protein [Bradyrhizobium sp. 1200_D9_N1_1]|uniref:hypothetical protein n=1 Tax=Bradyrhizobium sp. 1200_D9_N1_1 TaxID=3239013 RepID=UPI003F8A8675